MYIDVSPLRWLIGKELTQRLDIAVDHVDVGLCHLERHGLEQVLMRSRHA